MTEQLVWRSGTAGGRTWKAVGRVGHVSNWEPYNAREAYTSRGGHVTILDAGRATLEINDPTYAEYIDDVEVGSRVGRHIRVAFAVQDAIETSS